jgi:hypothetical protein
MLATWQRNILDTIGPQNYVGMLPSPAAQTYTIDLNVAEKSVIQGITLQTASGDIEVSVEVDGVAVPGLTSIVADSTKLQTLATTNTVISKGGVLTLVMANDNTPVDLSFAILYKQIG